MELPPFKDARSWSKRQEATCHPGMPAKAHGLCVYCYRHEYYLRNKQKEIDRYAQWRHDHPGAHARHNVDYRKRLKQWQEVENARSNA